MNAASPLGLRPPPMPVLIGPLTEAELISAKWEERKSIHRPLVRIHERHHFVARCLASGNSVAEAAFKSGYSVTQVHVLAKDDPVFRDLVESYRENVEAQYLNVHELMAGLAVDAILELRNRIEDEPEKIKTSELMEMVRTTADRTGNGPSSKNEVSITVGLADRLAAAKRRLDDFPAQMIEGNVVEAAE